MRVKGLSSLRSKLLKPCRKILTIFKLRLKKKPAYIRAPKTPRRQERKPVSGLLNGLFSSRKKLARPESSDDPRLGIKKATMTMVFPSPLLGPSDESCRRFENHLVEMIVEEGKLGDLADIEELLFCWKSLECPVFLDMVGRFYGDLCRDLFSSESK